MAKTPNFVTSEDFKFLVDNMWNDKTLPAGTFVRPIDSHYLPSHVTDHIANKFHDKDRDEFVYCHYGIISIPKRIIREV